MLRVGDNPTVSHLSALLFSDPPSETQGVGIWTGRCGKGDIINYGYERSPSWLWADGSATISASALIAVLINVSPSLTAVWGAGFLHELTNKQDGVIIVASLLLFPTTIFIYVVARVIFAAKEAVEKKATEKGRREGLLEGQQAERERIEQELELLARSGVDVPPEIARIITAKSGPQT